MKIGIDASRYQSSQATGVEWYSWHIIRALKKEVSQEDTLVLYDRKNIKCNRLWTLRGLSKKMRNEPPDVLFVPSHVLPLSLPKRSVITIHDVAFKHLSKVYSFFQYHYLNWSTKYAVKHASKIIVPSKATKKDLINLFDCPAEKIAVVAHGFTAQKIKAAGDFQNISPIFKMFQIDKSSKFLFFVGRLESKKNLVRLVEAFAVFKKKNPEYKLILAGKRGLGFKEILKKVQQLNLKEEVIMPGYITETEKMLLYKYCSAFVFTSLYEGFGLPILEAFSHAKPVLCSNVSSMPEVAGDAAVCVDAESVEEIAKGLEDVLQFDGEKGKERLKQFSWKKAAKETLTILHG